MTQRLLCRPRKPLHSILDAHHWHQTALLLWLLLQALLWGPSEGGMLHACQAMSFG